MQSETVAIFLAHLNPVTKTHVRIISLLESMYKMVYVFPVRFLMHGHEINTRSFPFTYELRRTMIESTFGTNRVAVWPNYTFYAPFIKYLPPLISPYSWTLRNNIVRTIKEKFVSYTGDSIERVALKLYRLNPVSATRLDVSASSIKEMIYNQAREGTRDQKWTEFVPHEVSQLIKDNWAIIRCFASLPDQTIKFMGMKFPAKGFL